MQTALPEGNMMAAQAQRPSYPMQDPYFHPYVNSVLMADILPQTNQDHMLAHDPCRSDPMWPSPRYLPTPPLESTHAPIPGRYGASTSPCMGPRPSMAGQIYQCSDNQWSGTLMWQCDGGPNLWATALTSDHLGDQDGSNWPRTWPNTLSLEFTTSASAVPTVELQGWVKKTKHVLVRFKPAFAPDGDSFGLPMLVDRLRENKCYAIASWVLQGNYRPTPNLLLTSCGRGLHGYGFPSSPMPILPNPQCDAVVNPTTIRQQVSRKAPGTTKPKHAVSQQQPQRRTQRRVTDYKLETNVPCAVIDNVPLVQNEVYSPAQKMNSDLYGRLVQTLA